VFARDRATVGIGGRKMSRVDAARIAGAQAEDAAKELKLPEPLIRGSVVASDAFFPFTDGLLVAIEAGATAAIQPGGSMRDNDIIKVARRARHRDGVHRACALPAYEVSLPEGEGHLLRFTRLRTSRPASPRSREVDAQSELAAVHGARATGLTAVLSSGECCL